MAVVTAGEIVRGEAGGGEIRVGRMVQADERLDREPTRRQVVFLIRQGREIRHWQAVLCISQIQIRLISGPSKNSVAARGPE